MISHVRFVLFYNSCYEADYGFFSNTFFNSHSQGNLDPDSKSYCHNNLEPIQTGGTVFLGEADIDFWQTSGDIIPGSFNVAASSTGCSEIAGEIDSLLQEFDPSLVVLSCGLNDIDNGYNSTEAFAYFEEIATHTLSTGSRLIVFGPTLVPQLEYLESELSAYEELLSESVTLFVDEESDVVSMVYIDVNSAFISMNPSTIFEELVPNEYTLSDNGYSMFSSWLNLAQEDGLCYIWSNGICVSFLGSEAPSLSPTEFPTKPPTLSPTLNPTKMKSAFPTLMPSKTRSSSPTSKPSESYSSHPTSSMKPTSLPTFAPSFYPTSSMLPTSLPTFAPTATPRYLPTNNPTITPSTSPSIIPTLYPTLTHTSIPTSIPSQRPSLSPTSHPSISSNPSVISLNPTIKKIFLPSTEPSVDPRVTTPNPVILSTLDPIQDVTPNPTNVSSAFYQVSNDRYISLTNLLVAGLVFVMY